MIDLGCNDHLVKSWIQEGVLSYFHESQKVENRVVDLTTTGMNRSKKVILPFRVRRWMLWWGHSPLPHWECWYPPGAWHSKHSVASWEMEKYRDYWQDKSDRLTPCLCKLSHLNTTLPLQSLISMWIFVGKWRESPEKWIFNFNFSVLELKELVNLKRCVKDV